LERDYRMRDKCSFWKSPRERRSKKWNGKCLDPQEEEGTPARRSKGTWKLRVEPPPEKVRRFYGVREASLIETKPGGFERTRGGTGRKNRKRSRAEL